MTRINYSILLVVVVVGWLSVPVLGGDIDSEDSVTVEGIYIYKSHFNQQSVLKLLKESLILAFQI